MRELLVPGRRLILESSDTPGRRTDWTLAAVEYRDRIIPLISSRCSGAAGALVIPDMFPGGAAEPEQMLGRSRIDWKVCSAGETNWVEVKSCTLVEHERAMFPDAPSRRAVRHLEELTDAGGHGTVIFTVMNPLAAVFSANPHTDPDFAAALKSAAHRGVRIRAVTMKCNPEGFVEVENPDLPVDLTPSRFAEADSGAVLGIWIKTDGRQLVTVERSENQVSRITRSRRIPPSAGEGARRAAVLPIRGPLSRLSGLEAALTAALGGGVLGSGVEGDILSDPAFLDVVLHYRHRVVFS